MHLIIQAAVKTVEQNGVDFKDKAKAIEILVGETIAAYLDLPTSPVTELSAYFNAHCKVETLTKLAEVNEVVVIDIDRASELVFKLWSMRYSLVHRMNDPSVGRMFAHVVKTNSIKLPECYRCVFEKHPDVSFSRYVIEDAKEYMNGH